jgi:holo-[acyl-carrier protein] synthase
MALIAHGIDLVDCRRIAQILDRHGNRFLQRILTESECRGVARLRDAVPHIAGRFAAKEAVFKVLGTGWRGQIAWTDVEVVNDSAGRPVVRLSGESERIARRLNIANIIVSITHTQDYAAASAIGLSA